MLARKLEKQHLCSAEKVDCLYKGSPGLNGTGTLGGALAQDTDWTVSSPPLFTSSRARHGEQRITAPVILRRPAAHGCREPFVLARIQCSKSKLRGRGFRKHRVLMVTSKLSLAYSTRSSEDRSSN
jgi:hypothetical protein